MVTETFRREFPAPLELRPLLVPEPVATRLANGLEVVTVEDNHLPLVSFRLAFRSGDFNDPTDIPGLSDMMTHLLNEGTETRSSKQIAEEIERIGATLLAGSGSDFTTVSASALSIYTDEVLDMMADITLRPSFPQNEIDLARENTKQLLIQQRAQPTFLATERVAKGIFGEHPYSRVAATPESLDAMTREGLRDFHRSHFIPNNAVLIAVGDIRPAKFLD